MCNLYLLENVVAFVRGGGSKFCPVTDKAYRLYNSLLLQQEPSFANIYLAYLWDVIG